LNGVDEIVLSPNAKGLTAGEISAHFAEIFPRKREVPPGASVSKETISRITDKVIEEMQDWAARPLDEVYAAVFIDAIVVKVRRRAGREPAYLCRDRCQSRRTPGRARFVGRDRR
jgi:transposase-like protein